MSLLPDSPWLTDAALGPGGLDWALGAVWATLLLGAGWRWRHRLSPHGGAAWLVPVLGLHLVAAVLLGAPARRLSSAHGDSLELYRSARHLWHHAIDHPADAPALLWRRWGTPADEALIDRTLYDGGARYMGQPYVSLVDNRQAYRLVLVLALLLPLAGGCYYPLALMAGALGMAATWALAQLLLRRAGRFDAVLLAAVVVSPSVLVWGSGVLKEPVVLAGLAAVFVWANAIAHREPIRLGPLALALLLVAVLAVRIKPYPMLLIGGVLAVWALLQWSARRPSALRWVVLIAFAGTFVVIALDHLPIALHEAASSRLYLLKTIRGQAAGAGSWVDIGLYDLSLWGALSKSPQAAATTLFGPAPWSVRSPATALMAAESALYALAALALLARIRWRRALAVLRAQPLIIALLIATLGYAAVLGLSVPNYGTLTRYRVVCIPLLLGALALWGSLSRNPPADTSTRRAA